MPFIVSAEAKLRMALRYLIAFLDLRFKIIGRHGKLEDVRAEMLATHQTEADDCENGYDYNQDYFPRVIQSNIPHFHAVRIAFS